MVTTTGRMAPPPARIGVAFVKREMGKSVDDYSCKLDGRTYSADELSALILKKIKQDAEACLGEEVTDAVITVPAYFGDSPRAATVNAGKIAGLNVLQLVNEPTAAAIAYGINNLGGKRRVFVFDLGGGTFDVTVMEVDGSTIRMVQTNGNHSLGGKDWDDAIALHVAQRFMAEHGEKLNPFLDMHAAQQLQLDATAAKEVLSQRAKTVIVCNHSGKSTRVNLTREDFESLTSELVDSCEELCSLVLNDADLEWGDIDTVLLAGGSTRMPMIRDMLHRVTGKVIDPREVNPDEVVALGAAVQGTLCQIRHDPAGSKAVAAAIAVRYGTEHLSVVDGVTQPLGVVALNSEGVRAVSIMLEKMEPVPCRLTEKERFCTPVDNLSALTIPVVQGLPNGKTEDEFITFDQYALDTLVLPLPPGTPRGTPVEITFTYTVDQILEVTTVGPDGRAVQVKISRDTLTQAQVEDAQAVVQAITVE